MVLKFVNLFTDLFPKGKAWDENQINITKLKNGLSVEFGRVYDEITSFYENFNIINKFELSKSHGKDYGLDVDLLNNRELQHIIVEYIYGDYELKTLVDDFATFIGASVTFLEPAGEAEFTFEYPMIFGSPDVIGSMQIFVDFSEGTTCEQYRKIVYIIEFFKPPYLEVFYSSQPVSGIRLLEFGDSQFDDRFGNEIACTL